MSGASAASGSSRSARDKEPAAIQTQYAPANSQTSGRRSPATASSAKTAAPRREVRTSSSAAHTTNAADQASMNASSENPQSGERVASSRAAMTPAAVPNNACPSRKTLATKAPAPASATQRSNSAAPSRPSGAPSSAT